MPAKPEIGGGGLNEYQLGFSDGVPIGIRSLDERWNGKGRPEPLAGETIPLGSRIALLAHVVDAKSHFTNGHGERVAQYSDLLAAQLGVMGGWLRRGALLHDIGKLGVSNAVRDKPARLNADEWARVQAHPRLTEEISSHITPFRELARVAGAHHERLDGKGYPAGIGGDAICLETRIITTCDIFDAITAGRPYREAISVEQALQIMEKLRGQSLDDECLDAPIKCLPAFNLN